MSSLTFECHMTFISADRNNMKLRIKEDQLRSGLWMLNSAYKNISVISFLVASLIGGKTKYQEKTRTIHKYTCNWQTFSKLVVSRTREHVPKSISPTLVVRDYWYVYIVKSVWIKPSNLPTSVVIDTTSMYI